MAITADFTGKDLVLRWTRNANNAANPDLTFKDFQADMVVNDVVERTLTIDNKNATSAIYYHQDMCADQNTQAPSRTISVRLRERDTFMRSSADDTGTFTNDPPAAPVFTTTSMFNAVIIKITPVTDADLDQYMIFRGTSAGFTPSTGNRIYMGKDLTFIDTTAVAGTTYYYKTAASDAFSAVLGSLNMSGALAGSAIEPLEIDEFSFSGIEFIPNSPTANKLSWTAGNAIRTVEGVVSTKAITALTSGTSASTSTRYAYYDWDDNAINVTTSLTTALAPTSGGTSVRRILATYKGGTNLISGVNEPIVDGERIIAGTVGAAQLVVGNAVITGTAQIANAVITTAHIDTLNASVIDTGYLNAARIQAGTINVSHLSSTHKITGNKIDANTITANNIQANTITANNIHGNTITGDRIKVGTITANNIAVGTITANNIATGTLTANTLAAGCITTAKLSATQLAVDTIHIKKGSLGFFLEKELASDFSLSRGVERILISYAIPSSLEGKIAIIGTWVWEADDDPDVRYRILRTRGSTTTQLGSYLADRGHGEVGVNFTMAAADNIVPGDIIRLALTRTGGGDVMHMFSNLIIFGVLR